MLSTHFVILNQTFVVILGTNDIKMLRKHPQKKLHLSSWQEFSSQCLEFFYLHKEQTLDFRSELEGSSEFFRPSNSRMKLYIFMERLITVTF